MTHPATHERLLEYLLVVGPALTGSERAKHSPPLARSYSKNSPPVGTLQTWDIIPQQAPKVLRKFPSTDHRDFPLPPDVAYFCLPDGCYVQVGEPECHVFMLTDTQTNIQTYGVCARVSECFDCLTSSVVEAESQEKRTLSLCILSRHPFFSFFKRCLATFLHFILDFCGDEPVWKVLTSESTEYAEQKVQLWPELLHWINRLLALKAPVPGEGALEVELEVDPAHIVCYPPPTRLPLLDLPVNELFQKLTICTVIDIFKLVISEQKVILYSSDSAFASECVLSIVALLYPLQYLFPVIPLLPTCMPTTENLLMVPTPFFIGVSTTFLKKLSPIHRAEVWLVNLDTKKIQKPETSEEESILQFPFSILQLQADLRKIVDQQGLDSPSPKTNRSHGSSSTCSKFSSDEANVAKWEMDVRIRVAFVQFLLSSEVLGNIDQHLSIYRLFPRPVVVLKASTFMSSYLQSSSVADKQFIHDLIQSQSVEYFLEWSLNPSNCAFEEIRRGTTSCEKIGDKHIWFIHKMGLRLEQVCLYPIDEHSKLFLKMLTYKADQAQYCVVQLCDVPSGGYSSDNEWEVLDHKGLSRNDPNFSDRSGGASLPSSAEIEVAGYMSDTSINSPAISGGRRTSLTESALQLHIQTTKEDVTQLAADTGNSGDVAFFHRRGRSWSGNSLELDESEAVINGHGNNGRGSDLHSHQRSASLLRSQDERFSSPMPLEIPPITRYSLPLTSMAGDLGSTRGYRGYPPLPPSVSPREMPTMTPLSRAHDDHMIQDLVSRVMDGQGIPWPKPPGMKTLAAEEGSRVAVLRMLEVRLGVRKPSDIVMATQERIQHVGVSRGVYKGLLELLKYFIQCIEQDYQRDPDCIIFSAFLTFRLAFSTFQKTPLPPSLAQRGSWSADRASMSHFATPLTKTPPLPSTPRRPMLAEVQTTPLGTSTTLGALPTPEGAAKPLVTPFGVRDHDIIEASDAKSPPAAEPRPSQAEPRPSQSEPRPESPQSSQVINSGGAANSTSTFSTPHTLDAMSLSLVSGPLLLSFYTPSTPIQEQIQTPSSLPSNMPPLHRKLTFLYQRMQSQASLINSPRILDSSDSESLKQEGSFLYKGLLKALDSTSQTMVLSREFWKLLFMSAVHVDRSLMGWNEQTSELYQRYNSLAEAHRLAFGFEEDDMLSLILHNLLVYMLMVGMGTEETLETVQRLAAKTRLATIEEKLLNQTLKHVEEKHSSDLDLTDLGLLPLYSESHPSVTYVVHYGRTMEAPVFYLQITDEACILKQFPDDKISYRLWNDLIMDVSCDNKCHVLTILYKDYKHHFHSKQYSQIYKSLLSLVYNRTIDPVT